MYLIRNTDDLVLINNGPRKIHSAGKLLPYWIPLKVITPNERQVVGEAGFKREQNLYWKTVFFQFDMNFLWRHLSLAQLERGVNNTMVMELIPVWINPFTFGLSDPCGSSQFKIFHDIQVHVHICTPFYLIFCYLDLKYTECNYNWPCLCKCYVQY